MRRALIETISRSEKRKDVLLLLQDGPVDMPTILKTLDVSRNALLPQIKILDEGHLVTKEKDRDAYALTKFGKLIVNDLQPLLGTLETLESKMDYWITHNTDFIPPELFNRLRELKDCELIEPELCEALELSKKAISMCLKSKTIDSVASLYHSDYPSLFMKYAENGSEFRFVITEEVLERFVKENKQKLNELLDYPNITFYIYSNRMELSALLLTPDFMLLRLLTTNDVYDPRYLMTYNQRAIKWSKELFQYYLDHSEVLDKL